LNRIWDKLFKTELMDDGREKYNRDDDVVGVSNNSSNNTSSSLFTRKCLFFFLLVQFISDYELPLRMIGFVLLVLWIALLDGMLVVFPGTFERKWDKKKVFVIGLSRTGTTSINEALNMIGIRAHHFCGPLVKLGTDNKQHEIVEPYVANLDGHTDIAATIVAEQLAEKYPEAVFIYTTRPREEWSRALVRFVSEQPRKFLFTNHPTPRTFYDAAYGEGWPSYSVEHWSAIHDNHEKRMARLKRQVGSKRFLKIDITALGKNGENKKIWEIIGNFLQVDVSSVAETEKFPHRYVFQYSAIDQPQRQIKYLLNRVVSKTWCFILLFVLVYGGRFFDSGQCTRACRVWNGNDPKAPPLAGSFTGNWFEPPNVFGRRIGWNTCKCYGSDNLKDDIIPRLHLEVATKDQWWFMPETTAVCGSDRKEYDKAADVPNSVSVTNCGKCGKCSGVADVNAMHDRAESLTKRASVGALLYLFAGKQAHQLFFRSPIVGFSGQCALCWYEATRCNLASCAEYCLFGWENPLSTESATKDGKLNSCMHCDEVKCSGYYLQSCGTNRRAAGVITDIQRNDDMEICIDGKNGAEERRRGEKEEEEEGG
jgi:hypothetical protein